MSSARFEIVRTGAGWHLRLLGRNHATVLTSEVYTRKRAAYRAVEIARDAFYDAGATRIEVVEIDERSDPPLNLDDAKALALWSRGCPPVAREIKADRKIHAIKELRTATGGSLLQCKLALDLIWAEKAATP